MSTKPTFVERAWIWLALVLTIIISAVVFAATALIHDARAADEKLTVKTVERYAGSGQEVDIWNLSYVKNDCTLYKPPTTQISKKADHGTVTLRADTLSGTDIGTFEKCRDKQFPVIMISYKANEDYRGPDTFEVFTIWHNGFAVKNIFKMEVK